MSPGTPTTYPVTRAWWSWPSQSRLRRWAERPQRNSVMGDCPGVLAVPGQSLAAMFHQRAQQWDIAQGGPMAEDDQLVAGAGERDIQPPRIAQEGRQQII